MGLELHLQRLKLRLSQSRLQLRRSQLSFTKASIVLQRMADHHERCIVKQIPMKTPYKPKPEALLKRKRLWIKDALHQDIQDDVRDRKQGTETEVKSNISQQKVTLQRKPLADPARWIKQRAQDEPVAQRRAKCAAKRNGSVPQRHRREIILTRER